MVGLIKTVEQNESIGASCAQRAGQCTERAEIRCEFYGNGDVHCAPDRRDCLDTSILDLGSRQLRSGRNSAEVELEGIRACVLNLKGVVPPALGANTAEAEWHSDKPQRESRGDVRC